VKPVGKREGGGIEGWKEQGGGGGGKRRGKVATKGGISRKGKRDECEEVGGTANAWRRRKGKGIKSGRCGNGRGGTGGGSGGGKVEEGGREGERVGEGGERGGER